MDRHHRRLDWKIGELVTYQVVVHSGKSVFFVQSINEIIFHNCSSRNIFVSSSTDKLQFIRKVAKLFKLELKLGYMDLLTFWKLFVVQFRDRSPYLAVRGEHLQLSKWY